MRVLLVAAGLCVGAGNVWADATVTLTSSYAVENYSKSFYIDFKNSTIDTGTYVDDISIGSCTQRSGYGIQNQNVSATPFTVNKSINKGDLLILQVGQTGTHGISVSVSSTVSNPIKNDGYLAFYATNNVENFTVTLGRLNYIAAMQVLSPSNDTYTINAVTPNGTFLKELATGTYTADAYVYYPYGIMKDGVCYSKAKNSSEPYWGFTNIAAGLRTIVYTANDWAYYSEMEDMNGASLGGTRYSLASRSSNGNWKWMNKNAKMYSAGLEAGTYSITVYGRNSKGTAQTPPVVILRSPSGSYTGTVATFGSWSGSSTAEYTAINVIIPEDGYAFCLFQVDYTSNIDLDYVYAVKTSDNTSVSPSVTDYATFSSPYALDFTSATGVKAYYASASDGSAVTMTKVTGAVAAGTGLLLQKTEGDISIPTAASGTDLSASNLLKPGTGAAVKTEGNTHRYVLAGEGASTSFYELSASDDAVTIPEGKAYLEVVNAGARLSISFSDGEATGIANVKLPNATTEGVYNLNGQRVAYPTKGLYIVNGKKVIKK